MKFKTAKLPGELVNEVKHIVIGTELSIGQFIVNAVNEKIERDNLRNWIETPAKLSSKKTEQ